MLTPNYIEQLGKDKLNPELFRTKLNTQTKTIKLKKELGHLHGLLRYLPPLAIE